MYVSNGDETCMRKIVGEQVASIGHTVYKYASEYPSNVLISYYFACKIVFCLFDQTRNVRDAIFGPL